MLEDIPGSSASTLDPASNTPEPEIIYRNANAGFTVTAHGVALAPEYRPVASVISEHHLFQAADRFFQQLQLGQGFPGGPLQLAHPQREILKF